MGKVAVGTGPCFFCQWLFSSGSSATDVFFFGFPPRAASPAAVSHPLAHCSPASSLVALQPSLLPPTPTTVLLQFVTLLPGRSCFLLGRGRSGGDPLGSHDLLPFLLSYCSAHSSEQEAGAQGQWEPVGHYGLRWVPIVFLVGFSGRPCAFLSSTELVAAVSEFGA